MSSFAEVKRLLGCPSDELPSAKLQLSEGGHLCLLLRESVIDPTNPASAIPAASGRLSGQAYAAARTFAGPRDGWWSAVAWESGGKELKTIQQLALGGAYRAGDAIVFDDTARFSRDELEAACALITLLTLLGVTVLFRMLGPPQARLKRDGRGRWYVAELVPVNLQAVRRLYGTSVAPCSVYGELPTDDQAIGWFMQELREARFTIIDDKIKGFKNAVPGVVDRAAAAASAGGALWRAAPSTMPLVPLTAVGGAAAGSGGSGLGAALPLAAGGVVVGGGAALDVAGGGSAAGGASPLLPVGGAASSKPRGPFEVLAARGRLGQAGGGVGPPPLSLSGGGTGEGVGGGAAAAAAAATSAPAAGAAGSGGGGPRASTAKRSAAATPPAKPPPKKQGGSSDAPQPPSHPASQVARALFSPYVHGGASSLDVTDAGNLATMSIPADALSLMRALHPTTASLLSGVVPSSDGDDRSAADGAAAAERVAGAEGTTAAGMAGGDPGASSKQVSAIVARAAQRLENAPGDLPAVRRAVACALQDRELCVVARLSTYNEPEKDEAALERQERCIETILGEGGEGEGEGVPTAQQRALSVRLRAKSVKEEPVFALPELSTARDRLFVLLYPDRIWRCNADTFGAAGAEAQQRGVGAITLFSPPVLGPALRHLMQPADGSTPVTALAALLGQRAQNAALAQPDGPAFVSHFDRFALAATAYADASAEPVLLPVDVVEAHPVVRAALAEFGECISGQRNFASNFNIRGREVQGLQPSALVALKAARREGMGAADKAPAAASACQAIGRSSAFIIAMAPHVSSAADALRARLGQALELERARTPWQPGVAAAAPSAAPAAATPSAVAAPSPFATAPATATPSAVAAAAATPTPTTATAIAATATATTTTTAAANTANTTTTTIPRAANSRTPWTMDQDARLAELARRWPDAPATEEPVFTKRFDVSKFGQHVAANHSGPGRVLPRRTAEAFSSRFTRLADERMVDASGEPTPACAMAVAAAAVWRA